jgi:hypothetical protein
LTPPCRPSTPSLYVSHNWSVEASHVKSCLVYLCPPGWLARMPLLELGDASSRSINDDSLACLLPTNDFQGWPWDIRGPVQEFFWGPIF